MSTFQPATKTVTLTQGDYLDRIRHIEAKAEAARAAAGDAPRMNDEVPEYLTLAQEHDALVKEAEESALHVVVTALPWEVWRDLVAEHPPREGNKSDAAVGVNEETFREALLTAKGEYRGVHYRTIVDPEDFADSTLYFIRDREVDSLYYNAFALNRGDLALPKADLVSQMSQEHDET